MQRQVIGVSQASGKCYARRHASCRSHHTPQTGLIMPFSQIQHAQLYRSASLAHSRSRQVRCQGLFGLGLPEIAVIAGVAALIFGPSKLPEIGRGLGKTVKSFQSAAKEFESELKAAAAEEEPKPTDATAAKDSDKEKAGKV